MEKVFLIIIVSIAVSLLIVILFGLKKKKEAPRWRLVPDGIGTYTLEEWNGAIIGYICKEVKVTKEEADKKIQSLEREIIYYREKN